MVISDFMFLYVMGYCIKNKDVIFVKITEIDLFKVLVVCKALYIDR